MHAQIIEQASKRSGNTVEGPNSQHHLPLRKAPSPRLDCGANFQPPSPRVALKEILTLGNQQRRHVKCGVVLT